MIVGLSAGQCTIPVDTLPTGVQKDARRRRIASRPTCTYREKVKINLDSPESRGETMKKSESNSESENNSVWRAIERLQKRVRELEGEVEALQRGDSTGFRHENDGGYFD